MPNYDTQYRPLPDTLTSESSPLCTAYHKIARDNANVLKGRAGPRKVFEMAQFNMVALPVGAGAPPVAESFVCQAKLKARLGFSSYAVRLWARDHGAAAAGTIRIRTDRKEYRGSGAAGAFDTSVLTGDADVLALTLDGTGVDAWYEGTVDIVRMGVTDPFCWMIVTAQLAATTIDFGMLFLEYKVL